MNQPTKPTQTENKRGFSLRRVITTILCVSMAAVVMLTCTQCVKPASNDVKATEAATEAETTAPEPTKPQADLTFETPNIPDDGSSGYTSASDQGLYIYKNAAYELCGASDEAGKDYAAAISEFKKSAPDFTVYNMVVPTHTEFGIPQRLAGEIYTQSQSQNIKTIYSSYTEDVKPINCYNALCRHKDEYVYFNTDHHWTGLGAYYAYQAFCEQTGQQALALTDCTEQTIEGFEGSFYSADASLSPDSVHYWKFPYQTHAKRQEESGAEMYDTDVYYEGAAGSGAYITFIYGDSSLFIEYNDTNKNGKKIAVVKESYGNAFVPYLTNNYEEVHIIDFRYFTQNIKEYMQENGITEILFLNNTMSANAAMQVDRIRELI
ncbi:DHHW family protein [Ruminococcus sp.]|uniref:DHHW family protein n=1 Tax=Ruminococcus sp. TaxID=41978 RepID=UPI003869D011